MSRLSCLPLIAIVALAGMLRCEQLGTLSYDFDEAFCWKMISFPPSEIWRRSALDNHPPLYFYLLWAWSRVCGDSPEALRSLSVAVGLATVAGAYFLVREVGRGETRRTLQECETWGNADRPHPSPGYPPAGAEGEGDDRRHPDHRRPLAGAEGEGELAGLAAAALMALSPLQVDWSQRVRMYALGAALAVLSCWLLLRALQAASARWPDFLWYALAAAALAYTHYYGLFVVAGQFLYAAGWTLRSGGWFNSATRPHPGPLPEGEGGSSPHLGYPLAGAEGAGDGRRQVAPCTKTDEESCAAPGMPRRAFPTEDKVTHPSPVIPHPSSFIAHLSSFLSHRSALPASFILIAVAYLPWLPIFLRHRQRVSRLFHTSAFAWDDVAKVCYQIFAVDWDGAPPSLRAARWAAAACLGVALAMFIWGRGGLRLPALTVLFTFDAAILASIGGRNIIGARYFVFAQALLVCGLAALAGQLPWRVLRVTALAGLVAASAWLCLAHAARRAALARRPGMIGAMAYLADVRKAHEPVVVCGPILQVAAAAHATRDERVLALGKSGAFPYFQGTAVMREDEYVSPQALANAAAERLWVIDAFDWGAPAWNVELPQSWIDVEERTFPEWRADKCRIVVRRCVKRRGRGGRPAVDFIKGASHVP